MNQAGQIREEELEGSRSFAEIQELCETFIGDCSDDKSQPVIADYLQKVAAAAKPTLLRNLLHFELERRRNAGEQPAIDEYIRALPEYSTLIRQVFYETTNLSMNSSLADVSTPGAKRPLTAMFSAAPFLGNYRILQELGRGGMGAVFEAEHVQQNYRVALKTLPALDGSRLHLFKREFRTIANVNHPNLIGLHSLESDGAHWFLTMDLIDGTDFLSYVRPNGQLDENRLRQSLPQLIAGVLALHGQHIIHRDLKPSNVMVDRSGKVVVLDFGLVVELGVNDLSDSNAGTPQYMAPEQILKRRITGAADWYAVGVMLYEALCGKAPFQGLNLVDLLHNKTHSDAPAIPPTSGAPADLIDLAQLLISRLPEQRPDAFEIAKRVSGSTAAPELVKASGKTLLVGRETQLSQLNEAREQVRRRGEPSVIFVRGRSGEGKTSLVDRFLQDSLRNQSDLTILAGRCYDRESVPFKALDSLIDALSSYLRRLPQQDAALMIPDDINFLSYLFPVLRRVEAVDRLSRKNLAQLDQMQIRARAFAALRAMLYRVTQRTTVILFADDLQWGDSDSAEVLSEVLKPPDAPALLLIGAFRSDEADTSPFLVKWHSLVDGNPAGVRSGEVSVGPLSLDECTELMIALVGQDNDQVRKRVREFAQQTGGNPFLLTELIACYDPSADSFQAIPIRELIDVKLGRLPPESADLLEVIAVSGQAIAWDEAIKTSGHRNIGVSLITHMRSEKLVRMIGKEDEPKVDTYHDKIRETVLANLDSSHRRSLHHALATVIAESADGILSKEQLASIESIDEQSVPQALARVYDLAYHFDAAGDRSEACAYALIAADQASRQFSQQVAAEQFRIAHRNMPAGNNPLHFRIALGEGRALSLLGRYDEALTALKGASGLTDDTFQQAQVLGLLAEINHKQGNIGEGVRLYSAALRKLGHWVPETLGGLVVGLLKETLVQIGHSVLPRRMYARETAPSRRENLAVELGNRKSIVSYYHNGLRMLWTHLKGFNLAETRLSSTGLAYTYGLHPAPMAAIGLCDRGLRYNDRAIALSEQYGDLLTQGHSLTMRSMALYTMGQYAESAAISRQSIDLLQKAGDPYLIFIASTHLSLSGLRLLDIKAAISNVADGFEQAVRLGEHASTGTMLMLLGVTSGGHFPFPELRACFHLGDGDHFSRGNTDLAEGLWHMRFERWDEAEKALVRSCALARKNIILCPYTVNSLCWLTTVRRLYSETLDETSPLRQQMLSRAWTNVRNALWLTRLFRSERAHTLREYGILLCLRGQQDQGFAQLRKSIQVSESQGDLWNKAHSSYELARFESKAGIAGAAERMAESQAILSRVKAEQEEFQRSHWR